MNRLNPFTFPLTGQQLIEASAGTGKTYTITNLYLRLLLGHSKALDRPLAVSEILVLTFTIAATEELRHRIRSRINQAKAAFASQTSEDPFIVALLDFSDDIDRDKKLLAAAIQLMDEAAIYTIHGFCARILQEQSFDTGVLFDQDLDGDKDQILQLACEDCYRQKILTLPEFERNMALAIWPQPSSIANSLKGFLSRPGLTILPEAENILPKRDKLISTLLEIKRSWSEDKIPDLLRNSGLMAGRKTFTRIDEMTDFLSMEGVPDPASPLWENWCATKLEKNTKKGHDTPAHSCLTLIDQVYQSGDILAAIKTSLWQKVSEKVKRNAEDLKVSVNQLTLDDLLTQLNTAVTSNRTFASHLASLFPCALVDEFQDTDDIQYGIFKAIYGEPGNHSLFLIGDPKQAIYQFRGADVFTYINAKRECGTNIYSLDTNWRSSPELIDAVNYLFDKPNIFDNDTDMPFSPVMAPPNKAQGGLQLDGSLQKPFSILLTGTGDKALNLGDARSLAMSYAAEEVRNLLTASSKGLASIDDNQISAGQIAFLVRSRKDAAAARDALAACNIRSVFMTQESIFSQKTSQDLDLVLQAIIDPTNDRKIRSALATHLLQTSAQDINSLKHDLLLRQEVIREFAEYHDTWSKQGIAAMIESLMIKRDIPGKWLAQQEGERQLTNLRHLSELLQQRSSIAPGMHRLLKWLQREIMEAEINSGEEQQLRLESDENLVKIVTMHSAKGLEYDIVFIPFASFYHSIGKKEPALFHRSNSNGFDTCLEIGSDAQHRQLAQNESLAEDMRLLYVAITRARYYCCLGISKTRYLPKSALARLLGIESAGTDSDAILKLLQEYPSALFDIVNVTRIENRRLESPGESSSLLPARTPPDVSSFWRLHSYSGVSRLIQLKPALKDAAMNIPGYGDDETGSHHQKRMDEFDRFSFPRGTKVGIALHSLMEDLDFDADPGEKRRLCLRCLNKIGLIEDQGPWLKVLLDWLEDILHTPLIKDTGLILADIPRKDRLDELEFHFPLKADASFLNTLAQEGYMKDAGRLSISQLEGIMTGLIDLVVRHDGKYYLMDYKSNHLGDRETEYQGESLRTAVGEHQYDLQYLIYCVALNRYLMLRVTDYQYDRDFGGVIYLFLRGMNGINQSGVYFDKPHARVIEDFDQALGKSSC